MTRRAWVGDKYFFFTVPVRPGWDASLEEITLTGPEGTVTVNRDDAHALSLVTDRASGRIRGILRSWEDALPATLETTGAMQVETTTRLGDASRLPPSDPGSSVDVPHWSWQTQPSGPRGGGRFGSATMISPYHHSSVTAYRQNTTN